MEALEGIFVELSKVLKFVLLTVSMVIKFMLYLRATNLLKSLLFICLIFCCLQRDSREGA